MSQKLLLKNKLTCTYTSKSNIVSSYLVKIIELRNQCFAISVKVEDEEVVPIALNGFLVAWETFV